MKMYPNKKTVQIQIMMNKYSKSWGDFMFRQLYTIFCSKNKKLFYFF